MKARILIAEDEAIVGLYLKQTVETMGYSVVAVVAAGEDVVRIANSEQVDLLLLDIRLADEMDGITAAGIVDQNVPVVFQTAYTDDTTMDRAKALNPIAVLRKPIDQKDLRSSIQLALG